MLECRREKGCVKRAKKSDVDWTREESEKICKLGCIRCTNLLLRSERTDYWTQRSQPNPWVAALSSEQPLEPVVILGGAALPGRVDRGRGAESGDRDAAAKDVARCLLFLLAIVEQGKRRVREKTAAIGGRLHRDGHSAHARVSASVVVVPLDGEIHIVCANGLAAATQRDHELAVWPRLEYVDFEGGRRGPHIVEARVKATPVGEAST